MERPHGYSDASRNRSRGEKTPSICTHHHGHDLTNTCLCEHLFCEARSCHGRRPEHRTSSTAQCPGQSPGPLSASLSLEKSPTPRAGRGGPGPDHRLQQVRSWPPPQQHGGKPVLPAVCASGGVLRLPCRPRTADTLTAVLLLPLAAPTPPHLLCWPQGLLPPCPVSEAACLGGCLTGDRSNSLGDRGAAVTGTLTGATRDVAPTARECDGLYPSPDVCEQRQTSSCSPSGRGPGGGRWLQCELLTENEDFVKRMR